MSTERWHSASGVALELSRALPEGVIGSANFLRGMSSSRREFSVLAMQRWRAVLFAMNVCLLTTAAALHLLALCEYMSSYRNAFHFTDTLSGFHVECVCSNCKEWCSFLSSQIPTPLFPLERSTDGKQLSGPLLFKAFAVNQAPKREKLMYCHSFGIQCQKWCNLSTFRSTCESTVYEQDLHLPFFLGFAFALGLLLLGLCGKVRALEMEMSKRSSCPASTGTQCIPTSG